MELDLELQGKKDVRFPCSPHSKSCPQRIWQVISLDFFEKTTRQAASERKNYCELEEKTSRRKRKEPEKPKATLLSFNFYWKILQAEKVWLIYCFYY